MTSKPIESLDSPRVILQKYADIDPDELGEDKFIGHHSLDKALKELEAYITERMIEYQAQLLKDYKEDIATAVREARIDERSQAQQYLHGLTITPESQHLFDVLSRNNYDRIKEIKRSKE